MKLLLIVNPIAGGRRKAEVVRKITERLEGRFEVEVAYTERAGHAEEIARRAVMGPKAKAGAEARAGHAEEIARGAAEKAGSDVDIVVAVGGDGTVNEVARGIVGTGRTMAIVPCGSGNGLARHIGIGTSVRKAVKAIMNMNVVEADCASVNGKLFMCTCGIGLDANVGYSFSREKGRGPLNYVRCALREWRNFSPERYDVYVDGNEITSEATLITIGEANQWGNNARITPRASICDGMLDIAEVAPLRLIDVPRVALLLMTGHLDRSGKVRYFKGKKVLIKRDHSLIHFDGEPEEVGGDIEIEVVEKALRLIVPKGRKV